MAEPHILIADDEPNIVLSLLFLMERAGYVVEVANDGEDAYARAAARPPDLMLLDVMLPRLSGFEVCRRLRALPACRDLPIVMLTAKGSDREVTRGLASGATAYITKPFSVSELVETVRELLAARR